MIKVGMEGMFFNRVPHPFNPQLMVNQLPLTVLNIFIIRILYMIMVRVKYLSWHPGVPRRQKTYNRGKFDHVIQYILFKGLLIWLKTKSLHTFVTQNIIQCFYKMLSSAMWHLMVLIKFLIGKIPGILRFCQS